ncbi:hypothetical protein HHI36_008233 [Cryptolaemus montrouzieri]
MWSWEAWLRNIFNLDMINTLNSKWIRLLVFDVRYVTSFLPPILQVLFSEFSTLKFVVQAIPPNIKTTNFLTNDVTRILPKGNISPQTTTTLGLLARKDFFTNYKIRRAVEEDNDDVVAIIDRSSSTLKQIYGEYYISELLRVEGTSRHIIVAEMDGYAVAVLIANEDVNYAVLNESFEVGPFHGFRTVHDDDDFYYSTELKRHSLPPDESLIELFAHDHFTPQPSLSSYSQGSSSEDIIIPNLFTSSESSSSSEDEWTLDPSLDLSTLMVRREEDTFDLFGYLRVGSQSSFLSTCLLNTDAFIPSFIVQKTISKSSSLDLRPTKEVSDALKKNIQIPNFPGQPDAFALEVLVSDTNHEAAAKILLESAFECFNNKNYCLMCCPSTEPPQNFLKDFVRVTPRNISVFPHDLFILHRSTIDSKMDVRISVEEDSPYIIEFLHQMMKPSAIFRQYVSSVQNKNSEFLTLIMTCENQIVGLAVISEHVDMDYLYAHYTLYKWIDESKHGGDTVGTLENFLIYPVFQRYCRYFLNQIHRLTDFSLLTYAVGFDDLDSNFRDRPLLNCIHYLVPVSPRRMPDFDPKFIEESCFPPNSVTETKHVFSLFVSMVRLAGLKRIEVNTRIVVIGTGDTAMGFLETLVCGSGPDLLVTFNNVTVVSPHGLPFYREISKARNIITVTRGQTAYHRILQMNLRIHVNIVHGVLGAIKRKKKAIVINELTLLPYDYLVLFCGEQYKMPSLRQKVRRKFSAFPENVFMINTDSDVIQVFNKMQKYKKFLSDKKFMGHDFLIVYGNDIRSVACLAALIEHGIPPNFLAFVEPTNCQNFSSKTPESPNLTFPDPEIAEAVDKIIVNLGVKLFKGFVLDDWNISTENRVSEVVIISKSMSVSLGCKFIFIYAEKSISNKTFEAINKAGLVFDGRLVIDSRFCTNDPFIFAAGPLTKYSRKYQADHKNHIYYNAQEVGETIGRFFREMLIPESFKSFEKSSTKRTYPDGISKFESSLPDFHKPIVISCVLPGEIHYLSIATPGKHVPVELMMTSDDYGQLLVTGDYEHLERQGYFRLHVNRMHIVDSMCCLSKEVSLNT